MVGDYRRVGWQYMMVPNRPQSPFRANSAIGSCKSQYVTMLIVIAFPEQRLRLGFDARLNEFTNLKVIGSMSGMSGVDTSWTKSDSKGLNHQRLDTVDLTRRVKKWDVSVGAFN